MVKERFSGMAISSFVLGIIGFVGGNLIFGIPGILSLIFGFIALNQIKHDKKLRGKTFAWWGIILSLIWLVFILIGIIWVVARNIYA